MKSLFTYKMSDFVVNRYFRVTRCETCDIDFKIQEFDFFWSLGYFARKKDVCPVCNMKNVSLRDIVVDRRKLEGCVVVVDEVDIQYGGLLRMQEGEFPECTSSQFPFMSIFKCCCGYEVVVTSVSVTSVDLSTRHCPDCGRQACGYTEGLNYGYGTVVVWAERELAIWLH